MTLYFLKLKDSGFQYDAYDSHVIRATSPKKARALAAHVAGDEGGNVWLDPTLSTCAELPWLGSEGIILSSYNAG